MLQICGPQLQEHVLQRGECTAACLRAHFEGLGGLRHVLLWPRECRCEAEFDWRCHCLRRPGVARCDKHVASAPRLVIGKTVGIAGMSLLGHCLGSLACSLACSLSCSLSQVLRCPKGSALLTWWPQQCLDW